MLDPSQETTHTDLLAPQPAALANASERSILQQIIADLSPLPPEARQRMIETVCTFFGIARARLDNEFASYGQARATSTPPVPFRFSEPEAPTPKQFLREKSPRTDIERVACLAYYLTHYRSTPHFKTKDISDLNTEAAQRRFSNAAYTVANATNAGYLVPSVKGCKQLSATGEQFVQALPDHEAAGEALERLKPRRGGKRSWKKAVRTSKG